MLWWHDSGALGASGKSGAELGMLAVGMDESALTDWSFPGRGVIRGEALARYVGEQTAGLAIFAIMGKSINSFELRDDDVVLRPRLNGIGSADFTARQRAIMAGREAALAGLAELRARIVALTR